MKTTLLPRRHSTILSMQSGGREMAAQSWEERLRHERT